MNQMIRIIGGLYRGKKLTFPPIDGLRPTPNRIRETLFNWLMHDIRNAHCLDAFAGSGALGFEAFSRGAAHVTLLEYSMTVYKHLQQQAKAFQSNQLSITHADTRKFLTTTQQTFDIIFFDPPFAESVFFSPSFLNSLTTRLRQNGLLYIESPEHIELHTEYWECLKSKKAGLVFYSLYRKR
jgi:16S rRNA (guanine966-N2)-methyltransferase